MLNKWRYCGYQGDGVSLYQCLKCYDKFESSHPEFCFGFKFCPMCGTQWGGKQEVKEKIQAAWKQYKPRFWWVIQAKHLNVWKALKLDPHAFAVVKNPLPEHEPYYENKWVDESCLDNQHCAQQVHKWFKGYKERIPVENCGLPEYQLRLVVKRGEKPYCKYHIY